MKNSKKSISLRSIFLGLQEQMHARLSLNRRTLHHPVAKGDASELEWTDLLSTYLPTRYQVARAFIIDHRGEMSQQIDIVIFDRHFSPFLFRQNGQTFVPAESVYAAIEVKQDLTTANIEYAAKKIASVRRLRRTNGEIVDRGVPRKPRPLPYILGGIVCLSGKFSRNCEKKILALKGQRQIDLGCSLEDISFFQDDNVKGLKKSSSEDSLIFFFLKLLARLQRTGTIPPMEIDKYADSLFQK